MTALGKMLVFLVLVLSLVWNGLVVNAYVTRTNWRNDAVYYQAEAKKAADSAAEMKKLLEAQREAAKSEKLALEAQVVRYSKQVEDLQKNMNGLNDTYTSTLVSTTALSTDATKYNAKVQQLQDQVNNQNETLAKREAAIDALTTAAEKSKEEAQQARLERDSQKLRADKLAERAQELASENETLRQRGGVAAGGGSINPFDKRTPAPERFRGTIQSRDVSGSDVLVSFTPGLDAGLQKGAQLSVSRILPGGVGKYLGKVTVIQADPKEAVGRFYPRTDIRLSADDYPRAGDELKPQ